MQALMLWTLMGLAWANTTLTQLQAWRSDEGLLLSYQVSLSLPRSVEQALLKGVPVHFEAVAHWSKERWYWSDKVLRQSRRAWRLSYQPLTREWRLKYEGISRTYGTLEQALGAITSSRHWVLFEGNVTPARDQYVDFAFRLDTEQLPRPLQVGLDDNDDWHIEVQRRVPIQSQRSNTP
jgi:hypothetical protein